MQRQKKQKFRNVRIVSYPIVLIVIGWLSFSFVKKDKNWYTLTTENFEISFPNKPDLDTNLLNSDIGILKMHAYQYDASHLKRSKNKIYSLVHVAYPSDVINHKLEENVDNVFRNAIDQAVLNVQGELLSEKKTVLDEFPGRIVEIDFQEGYAVILMHCYLVNNIMYMLQTISETNNYPNESSSRFIASFKLI